MLKKAILSASVLALASGIALAQAPMSRDTTTGRSGGMPSSSLSTSRWLASDIYKANVYDSSENKIGDVADLVMDSNGNVTTTIIGVGGFLGVGQKDIAVPFKERSLRVMGRIGWLSI
jgi:hypothetical protein